MDTGQWRDSGKFRCFHEPTAPFTSIVACEAIFRDGFRHPYGFPESISRSAIKYSTQRKVWKFKQDGCGRKHLPPTVTQRYTPRPVNNYPIPSAIASCLLPPKIFNNSCEFFQPFQTSPVTCTSQLTLSLPLNVYNWDCLTKFCIFRSPEGEFPRARHGLSMDTLANIARRLGLRHVPTDPPLFHI